MFVQVEGPGRHLPEDVVLHRLKCRQATYVKVMFYTRWRDRQALQPKMMFSTMWRERHATYLKVMFSPSWRAGMPHT
jgi:hypothetical protein